MMSDKPATTPVRQPNQHVVPLMPWLLAVVTAAVLLLNIPESGILTRYPGQLLIYAILTAIALLFGVLLGEDEFSIAHIVGMVAFLSLPGNATGALLWATFAGGLAASGPLLLRGGFRYSLISKIKPRRLKEFVFITGRVTLSFFAASTVYTALHGQLPIPQLGAGSASFWQNVLALSAFSLAYIAVYFGAFLLELYCGGQSIQEIVKDNISQISIILLLPVPFAILGANVVRNAEIANFVILVVGLTLIILGLHAYSLSEYRLRKQVIELQSLSAMTQAMRSHLNLGTLLNTIYLQVANLLNTDDFLVALYDQNGSSLNYPLVIRNRVQDSHFTGSKPSIDSILVNRILETRTPLLLSENIFERMQQMGLHPPRELVYSWLGVPLLAGGRILGAMSICSRDPHRHFGLDDLRLMNVTAASASIAIENAQLYQQQTERADQLTTLNDVSSLLAGTLSPESVLDTVISSASTISNANAVAIYLCWDDAESQLTMERSAGLTDEFATAPPQLILMQSRTTRDLHLLQPVVVSDIQFERRAVHLQKMMAREKKAAWVELPLTVGEQGLGVLVLYFDQPQSLTTETVELLRTFANQAAQAINNARLYSTTDKALERHIEQLFALAAMGRLLTVTMDTQQICDLLLGYATDATRAPLGVIALRSEADNTKLAVVSQRGYPEKLFSDPTILLQGLAGNVLESGRALLSGDVRKEPGYMPLVQNTRSQMVIPILKGKEILGLIQLECDASNAFSEEDSYFVGQIANQAVIAVDNVRLFQRITEARDRLQVLLDAMEEAIILIDNSGRIALANPRVSLINLTPSQLLDKNVEALLNQEDVNLAQRTGFGSNDALRQFVHDLPRMHTWSALEPVVYQQQSEHGPLYVQRQIIPVRDDSGKPIGALLMFYNKTEEQELTQARDELSQMIVHDLRSPLTAVTTSLRLLKDLVPPDNEFRPVVDTTTDASQRAIRKLLNRVDSLLDISRMESGQLSVDTEPAELATLVDSVCIELSPLAHELEVALVSQINDNLPLVDVDTDKMERLLLNLVDNALKYSPADSTVTIRAYEPGTMGAQENFVRVDVADTGPGIPNEYKERLFDRFVQVDGRRKVRRGVGLGLTFCRLVAEAHGGRIWIEDNPGGGSVFSFTVPIVRADLLLLDEDDEIPL